MKKKYKLLLLIFALPSLLALIAFIPGIAFLYAAGERAAPRQISKMLVENQSCLYERTSLLSADIREYKFEQYAAMKPPVVAVGSSRSNQFKQRYFNAPFFTFSGAVDNIFDVDETLRKLLALHKPEFIILQLDYRWFNREYQKAGLSKTQHIYEVLWSRLSQAYEPYMWMREGKLSREEYHDILAHPYKDIEQCRIGFRTRKEGRGYGRDGSYFYGDTYTSAPSKEDFEEVINGEFQSGGAPGDVAKERLDEFASAIKRIEDNNIPYLVVLPPLSPTAYVLLEEHQPQVIEYLAELNSALSRIMPHLYDLHDPAIIQTSDCEFINKSHGGEITYARLLKKLGAAAEVLQAYLDMNSINEVLENQKDHSVSSQILAQYMAGAHEADFLDLGCEK